jgi:hypothetical protein
VEHDFDHNGHPLPLPALSDEWLTPAEIRLREQGHRQRARRARELTRVHNDLDNDSDNDSDDDQARRATQNVPTNDHQNDHTATEPVSAPEGEGQGDVQLESITGSQSDTQPPVKSIQFDDTQVDFDEDLDIRVQDILITYRR